MISYSIVIDCPDTYLDILKIFFIFYEKNWSSNTHKIYVTSQNSEINHPKNVEFIKCGDKLNSIQRTKIALKLIKDKYVLILGCDDYFGKKVNEDEINRLLEYIDANSIKYVCVWKLKNREHKKYKTTYKNLYFCNKKARYSKSLMANLWLKDEYLKLFDSDNDDGWTIESNWLKETYYSTKGHFNDYCFYSNDPLHIVHAVAKGKWIRKAYRFCKRKKIDAKLLSSRKKLSLKETIKRNISFLFIDYFPSSFTYLIKRKTKKRVGYTSEF